MGNDAGIVFGMECGDTRKFVPRYTTILHTHTYIYNRTPEVVQVQPERLDTRSRRTATQH